MQRDTQNKARIAKRIIIIAVIIVAVIAVGISVALLIKNISTLTGSSNNTPSTSSSSDSRAPSARSIIETYAAPGTIRILTDDFTAQKTVAPARVTLTAGDYDYETSAPTDHSLLFVANDTREIDRTAAVITQTTAFLASKGYKRTADSTSKQTTYLYDGAVCQLTSSPQSTPASYLMACADKITIDDEYRAIESLLDIYKAKHQLDALARGSTTTAEEGDKAMTIVNLTTKHNQHPRLLFAAINNKWEYLGDVGQGTAAASNGKYTISTEVRAAASNPKYGDFLLKHLE